VLKLPIRTIVDKARAKRVNQYITLILVITAIPSIYFGYKLVQNERFSDNARKLIGSVSVKENSYLLDSYINSNTKAIRLIYSGYGVSDTAKIEIKKKALALALDTGKITIYNGTDKTMVQAETQKMLTEVEEMNNKLALSNFALQQSQNQLDSLHRIDSKGKILLAEIKEFYPQISSCSYSVTYIHPDTVKIPIVIYTARKTLNLADRNKIINWTKSRLVNDKTKVYFD